MDWLRELTANPGLHAFAKYWARGQRLQYEVSMGPAAVSRSSLHGFVDSELLASRDDHKVTPLPGFPKPVLNQL